MNDRKGGDRDGERPDIKVVDRRSFTSEGNRREEQPPEPSENDGPSQPPPSGGGKPVPGEGFTMEHDPEEPTTRAERAAAFLNLCVSIYESGCMHLGMGREGEETGAEVNLDGARGAVSMMQMLKRKTAGNLSEEESKVLDSLLADLQMAYVMKAPGASS